MQVKNNLVHRQAPQIKGRRVLTLSSQSIDKIHSKQLLFIFKMKNQRIYNYDVNVDPH